MVMNSTNIIINKTNNNWTQKKRPWYMTEFHAQFLAWDRHFTLNWLFFFDFLIDSFWYGQFR